ncbi:MAG: amino acid adenylation domain-containing protein [Actinobacteria bacterium]|nr:amino acid adenylation domain-containing protein [Actinomycetota bacterium]
MSPPLIHELVVRAAADHGDNIAVVDGDRTLTYAELDARSSRVANLLIDHGMRAGDRVGLLLEKSLEAVVGIYGALKTGAVYVPLDDQAPTRRLAYIARDAGIRFLVSSPARAAHAEAVSDAGAPFEHVLGSEKLPWDAVDSRPATLPAARTGPDSLAYVLYTSGSTGEPKGVMLSHENGMAFVDWAAREVGVSSQDRLSSHAPFHFDLSTFDLYAAAWAAAPVVLVPRSAMVFPVELARFIREAEITVWYSVPSALTLLVLRGGLDQSPPASLRAIIFAGEVFPTKYLARLIELLPAPGYFNFYGPTETNVCTWFEVRRDEPLPESLPIGRPLPGITAIIEDENGRPVAEGEPGELLIRGPTVMHGYWGDPERTARALTTTGPQRTYRTGDLVRVDARGDLEYLGRRDAQVKTRGYRVELGEIEAALNALPAVAEAAVVAIPDDEITHRLKAFVVTDVPTPSGELIRLCREQLPPYMIPEEFEFRESLPRSTTGKVNRRALQG